MAQNWALALSPFDRADIGGSDYIRIGRERDFGWQTEHVIEALRLPEGDELGPTIRVVIKDGDVSSGSVPVDVAHQPPALAGSFGTRRSLSGTPQHCLRAAGRGIVDMDWQEAVLALMPDPDVPIAAMTSQVTSVYSFTIAARWDSGRCGC